MIGKPDSERDYRADIDGLRAVAVSSVVMFHAGLFPFRSGFVGVDIFFVISGYLIGGIILRGSRNGKFDFANFYARRARRILPALFVVILSICLAGWFLLDAYEYHDIGVGGMLALVGASNIDFWQFQDYFAPDSRLQPLLMTWSLGIEEQFYLFFPWLIIAAIRLAPGRLLIGIGAVSLVSFGITLWWTWAAPAAAFFLLPSRAWELGIGAALTAWEIKKAQGQTAIIEPARSDIARELLASVGFLLLVVAIVGFDQNTPFPGFMALLPVLGTAALIGARGSWVNAHILSHRALVFVGLISYSWYLWHWPLMSFLRIIAPQKLPTWISILAAAVSFLLAVVSWRFVEKPFRRMTLPTHHTLLRYGFALLIVLVVPFIIKICGGLPQRLPEEARLAETQGTIGRGEKCLIVSGNTLNLSTLCVFDVQGRPAVALIGDSHATALAPGLRDLATREKLGYKIFAKSSCPPLLGVSVWSRSNPDLAQSCAAEKDEALKLILADPSIKVVLLAGFWAIPLRRDGAFHYVEHIAAKTSADPGDLLRAGLMRMVQALTRANKQVVVIGDTPGWDFDPLRFELARTIPLRGTIAAVLCSNCTDMRVGWTAPSNNSGDQEGRRIVKEVAGVSGDNVRYLDLFGKFCHAQRCQFEISGEPLFFDQDHLSPEGARIALQGFDLLPNANPH